MKKSLIATLADENYIDQVKQLFSSIYRNACWKGDYLLLAHKIPENKLKWFEDRGILIYRCKSLVDEKIYGNLNSVMIDKIYLFKKYFKKWQNIIYLDGDIIVKESLNELLNEKAFSAVRAPRDSSLKDQIISQNKIKSNETQKLYNEIRDKYLLKSTVFNAGFFVFNTDLINDDSFHDLALLINRCKDISVSGDQAILNFFFYNKWKFLPCAYNFPPYLTTHPIIFPNTKIKAVILHFIGTRKPWHPNDPFYSQWKNNLNEADKINFKKPRNSAEIWDKNRIEKYSRYLIIRKVFYAPIFYLDKLLGLMGIFVKNFLNGFHNFIK